MLSGPVLASASVALLALLPSAAAGTGSGTAATPPRTAAPPPPPPLYRVVGCVSHGRVAYRHGPARREVAIGFDDGPSFDTPQFVSMLERSRAHATFFLIGRQLEPSDRALLMRELKDGDVLGDHTFSHPELTLLRNGRQQLARTLVAIRALTGYTPCVFRPPYGAYDQPVIEQARALGLATVLWNVDPSDWALPGAAAIEQRVLAQVQPGSIVISHDGGGPRWQTLAAYPKIIAALRARGYRIVTIPQLLGFRPVYARCRQACDGIGVRRSAVPREAIVLPIKGAPPPPRPPHGPTAGVSPAAPAPRHSANHSSRSRPRRQPA